MPKNYRVELEENQDDDICPDYSLKEANIKWWEDLEDPVLNHLITQSLTNNYDLKIAVARVYEYFGMYGVVASRMYPQVNGDVYKSRQQYSLTTIPAPSPLFRRFNTFSALLEASFEFDIWGKLKCESASAFMNYLNQIEVRRTVVLTLVSQVAASYIELRKLDKQLEISVNTLKTRIEAEKIARARFREGLTSELPLKQAESETGSAIIAIDRLEIAIPQQENLISVLLGVPPGEIPRGKTIDDIVMPSNIPVGLPEQILNQRPDIIGAEERLIATNYDIGSARAAFLPDFSITAFYGNQSGQAHHLMEGKSLTWGTLGNVFQPLFTGGRLISELQIAKATNKEALYDYYNIVLNALKEVNDALIAHKKNLELVVEQQKQVKIFQKYRKLAELQYNNGESDYLNLLDAERRLFESELLLADTQGNSFTSLISLYKALGGGWVIDADNFNNMVSHEQCRP